MSVTIKWATIVAAIGVLSLLAGMVGALAVLEPYLPAHREFVRVQAKAVSIADAAQLKAVDASLIELKIIALRGQISAAETQLAEVTARLMAAPGDAFLSKLKKEIQDQVDDLTALLEAAECEQRRLTFPNASC